MNAIPDGFCIYNTHNAEEARVITDINEMQTLFSGVLNALDQKNKPQLVVLTVVQELVPPQPVPSVGPLALGLERAAV